MPWWLYALAGAVFAGATNVLISAGMKETWLGAFGGPYTRTQCFFGNVASMRLLILDGIRSASYGAFSPAHFVMLRRPMSRTMIAPTRP